MEIFEGKTYYSKSCSESWYKEFTVLGLIGEEPNRTIVIKATFVDGGQSIHAMGEEGPFFSVTFEKHYQDTPPMSEPKSGDRIKTMWQDPNVSHYIVYDSYVNERPINNDLRIRTEWLTRAVMQDGTTFMMLLDTDDIANSRPYKSK